jgi:hypothetical protein
MRPIGFSTGALAFADFRRGVNLLMKKNIRFAELSALRQAELDPLCSGIPELDLSTFLYISIHAPSKIERTEEGSVVEKLLALAQRGWPIVLHPDAVHDFSLWQKIGNLLCVENMDKRKPTGRTVQELHRIFKFLPDAKFCFDIGHARQVDPSMKVAHFILKEFGHKLTQVHLSEVNTCSRHDALSYASILAFREVAEMIPENIPIILESTIPASQIDAELVRARESLTANPELLAAV